MTAQFAKILVLFLFVGTLVSAAGLFNRNKKKQKQKNVHEAALDESSSSPQKTNKVDKAFDDYMVPGSTPTEKMKKEMKKYEADYKETREKFDLKKFDLAFEAFNKVEAENPDQHRKKESMLKMLPLARDWAKKALNEAHILHTRIDQAFVDNQSYGAALDESSSSPQKTNKKKCFESTLNEMRKEKENLNKIRLELIDHKKELFGLKHVKKEKENLDKIRLELIDHKKELFGLKHVKDADNQFYGQAEKREEEKFYEIM